MRERTVEATKVGIREFRSALADFIASDAPIAVTRHGQTVGYFIPTQGHVEADVAALKKASIELDRLLAAQGAHPGPRARAGVVGSTRRR